MCLAIAFMIVLAVQVVELSIRFTKALIVAITSDIFILVSHIRTNIDL